MCLLTLLKVYASTPLDFFEDVNPISYAGRIVQSIQNAKASTSYGYGNTIQVDEDGKSHYEYTCYGFLDHVLSIAHPCALEALRTLQKTYLSDLPISFDEKILPYHLVMLGERMRQPIRYWEVVRDIKDIQSGDIVSYMDKGYTLLKDPPPHFQKTGTHVMVVDHVERFSEDDAHLTLNLWIIDATRQPHNRDDSRYHTDPLMRKNGIGRSPLVLRHDKTSKIGSIQWSKRGHHYEKMISVLRYYM